MLQLLNSSDQRKFTASWIMSLKSGYLLKTGTPWFTFDAINYLQTHLQRGGRVFEYGSGGSTLFWLSFEAALVVSIEHDRQWFDLLNQHVGQLPYVDYRLITPERETFDGPHNPADPTCYCSEGASFCGYSFRNYVGQIDEFPNDYFDVVSIDGRARPSCIMHSVGKVKPGGILILDNAERSYYTAQTQLYLQNYRCNEFYGAGPSVGWMWQTDIYVREK